LEVVFHAYGQEALDVMEFRRVLGRYAALSEEEQALVLSFAEKQGDGKVLWKPFLRWAGLVN